MGGAWSTGSIQAFSAPAFSERRSSSALLDKGFAALERDFEASNRRLDVAERTEDFPTLPVGRSSPDEADFDQLESPALSPQHDSAANKVELKLIWMDGSVIQLKVSLTATCNDVISSLHRRGVISTGCPRLLLGTSLLEGGTCLSETGVSDGSELQLVLSQPCLNLDVSDNNLGDTGLEALVEGLPGPLQRVSLLRSGLCGKAGGRAVAKLMKASPGLEFLDLSGNNGFGAVSLGDTGIDLKALAAEIHSCYSLVHVTLADCSLEGFLGGQQLACLLYKTPNLQRLDVHSNNNLGSTGMLALSSALSALRRPLKLTGMTLEDTGLEGEEGGDSAGILLHRIPFLTSLNISNNLLLPAGLQALVKTMPDTTCISRLDACNIGLPCKLGLQEADFFRLLLEKCPGLKLVESEGHTFDGPPQFNEILSRMELIRTPGEVHDQIELLDISQLVLDHPLVATDFKRLTGLSLQQLQKLRSFNLNSLNHSFHSLPGNLGGIEGGIVLVKVLDAMSSIEHLSFNASRLGVAWTLGVGQVLIESLRSESGIGRERPDGSQLTIPRIQLTSLKSIDLSECGLHADAGSMLAELLQALPGLRGLSLARNYRLENAGVQAFANRLREEARGHSLVEIDLSCCSLSGEEGKVAVLAMLQHLPELDALAVSSNPGLGPHVAPILEHVLCNTQISSLSFGSCGISANVRLNLALLRSPHLTSLDMSGNTEIGPLGLQGFTSQLPKMNLQRLNLADCGLESRAGGDSIAALVSRSQSLQ